MHPQANMYTISDGHRNLNRAFRSAPSPGRDCVKARKSHLREWVDCSDPFYKKSVVATVEFPQRQLGDCSDPFYKKECRRSRGIPPTAVGGLFQILSTKGALSKPWN